MTHLPASYDTWRTTPPGWDDAVVTIDAEDTNALMWYEDYCDEIPEGREPLSFEDWHQEHYPRVHAWYLAAD